MRLPHLLIVSHPSVLPVNQLAYAELADRGWEVDLVVPNRWTHDYGTLTPKPLPSFMDRFHPLPVLLAGRPQRHLYRACPSVVLRRLRPDVVFLEQEPFSAAAFQWGLASHRRGVPFGVQAAENLNRTMPAPVRLARSWVLRNASFVAARSDSASRLAEIWGAAGEIRLVPHHVPDWPVEKRSGSEMFRVGFAGRLVPEKGLDVLVSAVRRLGAGVELVIAGNGPLRDWLEREDLGGAALRMLPKLQHAEMADAYASMDVLVLPSRATKRWVEQFGRVLVEALWCGVPVIGSDSGEIRWVIGATGGGRVVPEGDPAALAEALAAFRDDPAARRALAEHGQRVVQRTFSVPAVADALGGLILQQAGARRLRVALVAHGVHDDGGMERACAELVRQWHGAIDFTVVAAELAPELRALVGRWVRVRVPMRPIPLKFLGFFLTAGAILRRLDVDLIHTVGAIVPNRVDVSTIQFCHAGYRTATGSLAPRDAPIARRVNSTITRLLALLAERWCYRASRLRAFAAVSDGVAAEVSEHYPGIPVSITPNGVDTERFRPDLLVRATMRAEHGIGADVCVVLFVGGDWDRKGLAIAIKAVAKARQAGAALALWVVGSGNEARFAALAEELGVADAVSFFGRRSDTERYYVAADVFVLPSGYETFGIVCFEAAASGLALVVTPIHGARELVGANEAGLLVERDAASVADALTKLANDPLLRGRLSGESARRVQSFTWEVSASTTARLYGALTGQQRAELPQ